MAQSDSPILALTELAIHLLARVEALEALLIQKGVATKQEIQAAIVQAEGGLALFSRGISHQDEKGLEPALKDLVRRLKSRHGEQLR